MDQQIRAEMKAFLLEMPIVPSRVDVPPFCFQDFIFFRPLLFLFFLDHRQTLEDDFIFFGGSCRVCASHPLDRSRVCEERVSSERCSWQVGLWDHPVGDLLRWRGPTQREETYRGLTSKDNQSLSIFFLLHLLLRTSVIACLYYFLLLLLRAEGEVLWNWVPARYARLQRTGRIDDPLHELWPQEKTLLPGDRPWHRHAWREE